MSKRVSDDELLKLVHHVKAKKEALPPVISSGGRAVLGASIDAHHAAARTLVQELVKDHGARLSRPLGGLRLSMGGVSATCTSGESGLLTNWVNAAYRKLDQGRAA